MAGKKRVHPSLLSEESAFGGAPQHGDAYEDDDDVIDRVIVDDDDDGDEEPAPEPKDGDLRAMMMDLNRKVGELTAQNEHLRRSIPPATARPAEPEIEEDDGINWDELLFKDPKKALKLHGEQVAKQVEKNLTRKYEADQSNTRFWTSFYRDNEDLKDDHDLVLATMQKHFNEIGNMPSGQAQEKLADLTRARILKYSGKSGEKPKKRSRAQVEGAAEPRKRPVQPQPENVTSLSSVLKKRRELRYKRGKVA